MSYHYFVLFYFLNVFDPWLVESAHVEPEDMEGWLYFCSLFSYYEWCRAYFHMFKGYVSFFFYEFLTFCTGLPLLPYECYSYPFGLIMDMLSNGILIFSFSTKLFLTIIYINQLVCNLLFVSLCSNNHIYVLLFLKNGVTLCTLLCALTFLFSLDDVSLAYPPSQPVLFTVSFLKTV